MKSSNDLRYAKLWYLLGAGLTLLIIIASLVPTRDLPWLPLNDKLEHLLAYLALALWFGGLVPPRGYVPLALELLALGGGIEITQWLMGLGREADWLDFRADAVGIALGLALCLAGLRHWAAWLEQWPRAR